jgi:hypothetical protein
MSLHNWQSLSVALLNRYHLVGGICHGSPSSADHPGISPALARPTWPVCHQSSAEGVFGSRMHDLVFLTGSFFFEGRRRGRSARSARGRTGHPLRRVSVWPASALLSNATAERAPTSGRGERGCGAEAGRQRHPLRRGPSLLYVLKLPRCSLAHGDSGGRPRSHHEVRHARAGLPPAMRQVMKLSLRGGSAYR